MYIVSVDPCIQHLLNDVEQHFLFYHNKNIVAISLEVGILIILQV